MTSTLQFIKKTRPKLKIGDVFTYHIDSKFYFGIVISTNPVPRVSDNIAIAVILTNYYEENLNNFSLEKFEESLSSEKLIAPPTVVNKKPWTQGFFKNIDFLDVKNLAMLDKCRLLHFSKIYKCNQIEAYDVPDINLLGTVGLYAYEGVEYLIQVGLNLYIDKNESPYKFYGYIEDILGDTPLPYWYYNSIGK